MAMRMPYVTLPAAVYTPYASTPITRSIGSVVVLIMVVIVGVIEIVEGDVEVVGVVKVGEVLRAGVVAVGEGVGWEG